MPYDVISDVFSAFSVGMATWFLAYGFNRVWLTFKAFVN